MSEYSKEKLYFLKLPKSFFNEYYMKILEAMPNGKEYELMYLKLLCESLAYGGYLRFSPEVPYTADMIAAVTNTNIDVVRSGLIALSKLQLVEETKDGSLFFPNVSKLTIETTKGAITKQEQRKTLGGQTADNCPPDIRYKSIDTRYKSIDTTNHHPSLVDNPTREQEDEVAF